jgi:hypothetical protein
MEEIHKLNEWTLELHDERVAAEKKERATFKKFVHAHEAAFEQLQKLKRGNESRRVKEDELINKMKALSRMEHELDITKNLLEKSNEKKLCMKKEWSNLSNCQRKMGAGQPCRPTWVVLMICELLISGTAPTAVPSTIQIIYETLYKEKSEQLPSVNFVRECRVVIEVIGEIMAAIKLA